VITPPAPQQHPAAGLTLVQVNPDAAEQRIDRPHHRPAECRHQGLPSTPADQHPSGPPRGVSKALSAARNVDFAVAKHEDNSSDMGGNLSGSGTGSRPHPRKMGRAKCHRELRVFDRSARAVLDDDGGSVRHESRRGLAFCAL
jgi:hypothetical protein